MTTEKSGLGVNREGATLRSANQQQEPSLPDSRIVEEFNHRAPFRLEDARLLVLARVGSHSHGTYVPPSDPQAIDDVDFMGVVVPPVEYVLGIENWEGVNFQRDELDCVFYSFEKFMRLLVKSNPNVLGLLWLRDEDIIAHDATWWNILEKRMEFSSLDAYNAFIGYAYGQLKRMTAFDAKTTKEWDDAVTLVETAGWDVNACTDKSATLPMPNYAALNHWRGHRVFEASWNTLLTEAKVSIQRIHARHFQGYMGEKRKALVRQYGYDTKNAAHLIRLMRMCLEFLDDGKLRVYRTTDAQEIRDIKAGRWTLELAQSHAQQLFDAAKVRKESSPLPETPDRKTINRLVVELQRDFYETLDRLRSIEMPRSA